MTAQKGRKDGRGGSGEQALRQQLEVQLSALAGLGPRAQPAEITDAVESVMATVEGDLSAVNLKLYAEIEALSRFIAAAKAEIASVRPDEINTEHLPTATDELEAIVGATESATNTILEAIQDERDLEPVYGREGEAPRSDDEIGVFARRAGDIRGEHELILAGNDEVVSLFEYLAES